MTQDLRVPWDEDPGDLYENAPCGYLTTLPDGTIVRVNETLLTWTGHDRAALLGRRFQDLLTAGDKIYHEAHYAPLLHKQDEIREVSFDLVRADGSRLPTLVDSSLSRDPEGAPRSIRTTVFDVTERRGYERELLAAQQLAAASERRVGVLQQVAAELAAATSTADVARAVVGLPGPAFGAAAATVWLTDPDRDQLHAVAGTDPAGPVRDDIPRTSSRAVAAVSRRGDLHVIGSIEEAEEHFPELAATMRRTGRGTVVLLPLTITPADDRNPTEAPAKAPSEAETPDQAKAPSQAEATDQASDRAKAPDQAADKAETPDQTPVRAKALNQASDQVKASDRIEAPGQAGPPVEVTGRVEVLGVLGFEFAGRPELTPGDLRVVRLLGQQAGQALERARLTEDARRHRARAELLARTTRALEAVPRLMPRARRLVELLVPEVAEWAAVRLQVGPAGLLADAGGPAPDPERLAERVSAVAADGVARLTDSAGPDPDCAVLPLAAGGRVLGTLALRMAPGRRTAAAEAVFLRDLADRAGLALENARLHEQEQAIARTLQRSLLAGDVPADPRFVVETHYQAAGHEEVGGDWFDAFLITPDKLAVVVGDVVGRGIDAATTMGQLRSAIRALASAEAGPARLLERLDSFVARVESARMATIAYAEVDLTSSELVYACAGHMPPLLVEPGGSPRYLLDARSGALGSRAGRTERLEHRTHLAPGGRLLLYTDGLVARRSRGIDTGFEMLARAYAGRRDAPLPGLATGLAETLVGRENGDDVCLLCLSLGTDDRLERSIGADPVRIALLRKDLRGWLISHAVDDESAQAVLLASSEAVANAIEHGYHDNPLGMVDLVATVTPEAVEVRVADRGGWREPTAEGARGRGLPLIRQVMDHVAIDRDGGTTVTMRRDRREQKK